MLALWGVLEPQSTATGVWLPRLAIDVTARLVRPREPYPLLIMSASDGTASPRQ